MEIRLLAQFSSILYKQENGIHERIPFLYTLYRYYTNIPHIQKLLLSTRELNYYFSTEKGISISNLISFPVIVPFKVTGIPASDNPGPIH